MQTTFRAFAILLLLLATAAVRAEDDPLDDPAVQKTLHAMADASTWYHPDQFGEFAGMRHYAHQQYDSALSTSRSARTMPTSCRNSASA